MKFLNTALAASALLLLSATAHAEPGPLCKAKQDEIRTELSAAKAHGQTHRVRGLERALSQVQDNCTDAKLQAEHQRTVRQQEKKVAERQRELDEERREGKPSKVAKRQEKLDEAQAELARLRKAAPH